MLEGVAVAMDDLENITSLPPIAAGQIESANEPYMSTARRIQQSQIAQGVFFDNFLLFDTELHRVILDAIPANFTEAKVFRYTSPTNELEEVAVNQPGEIDPFTLEVKTVVNRLDAGKYDYLQAVGDNSVTGRETEFGQFMQISADILRNMPAEQWENLMKVMPNTYAQSFAQSLMQERMRREEAMAAQGGPQPEPARIQVQLSVED